MGSTCEKMSRPACGQWSEFSECDGTCLKPGFKYRSCDPARTNSAQGMVQFLF